MSEMSSQTAGREIIIKRTINAPRPLVFKMWTEPEHMINWWGPAEFTNTFYEIDVKPGGVWRFTMHAPDGTNYPNRVVFNEIIHPERITYTHGTDEEPEMFEATILFEDKGSQTGLVLKMVFATEEGLQKAVNEFHAIEGGHQHLECLEQYIACLPTEKFNR